jgi:hypothetical protein
MKLGDALNRRADLRARIQQLPGRLAASAVMQEGDAPPEDPAALLDELDAMSQELQRLVAAINETNARTTLADGRTLTAALAERDALTLRNSVLRASAEHIVGAQARYSRSELRMVRQLDLGALRTAIDHLAQRRREIDTAIQEHNWTTELIET